MSTLNHMKEIMEEYNRLIEQLAIRINQSNELSKLTVKKLEQMFKGYELIKKK